jgi:Tol biopolymer transport system component
MRKSRQYFPRGWMLLPASGLLWMIFGCAVGTGRSPLAARVPHEARWGIYSLNPSTQEVDLLYSTPEELSGLQLNTAGDRFVFSQKVGGNADEDGEIFAVGTDGRNLQRLTSNLVMDTYPVWSPDGSHIAFLSRRGSTLDIFVMDADGGNARLLYDSGFNDADIHWVGNTIAFTRNSRIWIMNDDGSEARALTDPPRAEEWGSANLPFGDYDPRISPDGSRVVFERLVNDSSPQGNYDLYLADIDGSNLIRLTNTGYAQGLANWSRSGNRIVYIVAAIDGVGKYDIYTMLSDGKENSSVTPAFFPAEFLCRAAAFSGDDALIYFLGEWWPGK